jgi:hypothetical protein
VRRARACTPPACTPHVARGAAHAHCAHAVQALPCARHQRAAHWHRRSR